MKLDLKDIQKKRTNLNAQEIGDDKERAKGWKRFDRNPVFDEAEVQHDGRRPASAPGRACSAPTAAGAGSPAGASTPGRTPPPWSSTACRSPSDNDVALPAGMLERGVDWLKNYQAEQVQQLKNAADQDHARTRSTPTTSTPWSTWCWSTPDVANDEMREFLYRDRTELAVYAKAMFGLALHKQQQADKLAMILQEHRAVSSCRTTRTRRRICKLPADNSWWYWYGSEIEANAYYLKLLATHRRRRTRRRRGW